MIAHSLDCMFDERPTGMRSRSLLHPVITKWQTLPANVRIKGGGRMGASADGCQRMQKLYMCYCQRTL